MILVNSEEENQKIMAAKRTPGERIIELCKTYSISREVLAERSGLNIELIRRIEEGHIPDLAPLVKIARGMGVRLGTLMDDHEKLGPVITRRGEAETTTRFVTGLPGDGKSGAADSGTDAAGNAAEVLSPESPAHQGLTFKTLAAGKGGRHMEPFIVDIEPGSVQEKSTHEGEEFIHILSGKLRLEYGKDTNVLDAGDSVYYDSIVPHRVLPVDNKPVRILAVIYSPA
ncbi:MAG: cupin domain-containing protein [Spirochaetaceae bacterium]|jgi:quercetin dioxygenase-like cupin family protein/transcriptional regulator with XRE-family HTH domain|nr:cupin domain-containing protein [Spirochaetaceae bacterium]